MSFEAKALFLKNLEQKLASEVTANNMTTILSTISDQLANFSMTQIDMPTNTNDDLLDSFMSAMQIEGRSSKTIERYRYLITRMMQVIKLPTRNITVHHLRQYLANEKARGISDRTLEGIRQVFSAYFNWLQRERLIDINPTANLGSIKCPKKIKSIYSEVDIEKLKFYCTNVRDRAIVSFLLIFTIIFLF